MTPEELSQLEHLAERVALLPENVQVPVAAGFLRMLLEDRLALARVEEYRDYLDGRAEGERFYAKGIQKALDGEPAFTPPVVRTFDERMRFERAFDAHIEASRKAKEGEGK